MKSKRMKILVVHELFMPDFVGGGEKLIFELVKGLKEKGHQVDVLTTGNPKIREYKEIRTKRIKCHRYLFNFKFREIARVAKNYDLIQTSSYNSCFPSYIAGKISKKPVVCTIMGVYGKIWKKMTTWHLFYRMMEKVVLRPKFTHTIFLSEFSKNIGTEIGMYTKSSSIIPVGVNVSQTKQNLKKENYILFVGRFVKQKGLELLMEAAQYFPEYKVIMVGEGPEEKKLKEMVPKNVIFVGTKRGQELWEIFGKAKIFCLPSYGEGFPVVIVEAMASGCAVISTLPYPYQGYHLKERDPQQLAEKIKEMMTNNSKTTEMSRKNVELAQDYTWDNFVGKTEQVYREVLRLKR
jgi:glycosyltransferase involved in cell wall biosynthesis